MATLSPNSWTKVYDVYGTVSTTLQVLVNPTDILCEYRVRVGYGWFAFNRSSGKFRRNVKVSVWNGYLQIKSPTSAFVDLQIVND